MFNQHLLPCIKVYVPPVYKCVSSLSMSSVKLIEKLLCLIVVVILSRIGTGHNHDDVIAALHIEVFVPHGWLEKFSVFFDPRRQVEGFAYRHETLIYAEQSPNEKASASVASYLFLAHLRAIRPRQSTPHNLPATNPCLPYNLPHPVVQRATP